MIGITNSFKRSNDFVFTENYIGEGWKILVIDEEVGFHKLVESALEGFS